jgi:hypothetical protein
VRQRRQLRVPGEVVVEPERGRDRAGDRQRPRDAPLQHAVVPELRDDHVDRGEARVARRRRDRGRGVVRPGRRQHRDPEDPEHDRLSRLEHEPPPLLHEREDEGGDADVAGELRQADAGRPGRERALQRRRRDDQEDRQVDTGDEEASATAAAARSSVVRGIATEPATSTAATAARPRSMSA